jgi:hypothetical protein
VLPDPELSVKKKLGLAVNPCRSTDFTMSDFADYRSCAMISMRPNQSMKPTAPLQYNFSVFATTLCRGLSLSR